jgi:hypothetical protein
MVNGSARLAGCLHAALLLGSCWVVTSAAADAVSYNRDIRPIMSGTCFHCHGNDAGTREAGLRLDIRAAALAPTDSGLVPIVPGDPDASGIIQRIFAADDPMPPESAHKPLTAEQKEIFRRWVAAGAEYEPHWAYAPLIRPQLPGGHSGEHPIDAFIAAGLEAAGLAPAPEAPPQMLERRLALDLTGLPPEAALGEAAPRPTGDALVAALLASHHFGERMAVWWLDIARYADTVGFHGDQNQRIFPYRDYVIDSFNSDKRFDQFTREQLAGDLLPNPTAEQLVATGYNRLNMMTREGGAQPKEYLAKYGAERVRSVAAAWFGSTFGCAECHDHKFDPISSRDFYELQAFFADIKQYGVYSTYPYTPEPELQGFDNDHPFPPEIAVESSWLRTRHDRLTQRLADHLASAASRLAAESSVTAAQIEWESNLRSFLQAHPTGWLGLSPSETRVVNKGQAIADRPVTASASGTIAAADPLGKNESLEVVFAPTEIITVAAIKVRIAWDELEPASRAARAGSRLTLGLFLVSADGKRQKIPLGSGDATCKRPVYRSGAEVPGLGNEWRLPMTLSGDACAEAVWLVQPFPLATGDRLVAMIGGEARLPIQLAVSPLGGVEPLTVASATDRATLVLSPSARSADQVERAGMLFLLATAADRPAFDQAHALARERAGLFGGRAWSLVTESIPDPLPVRILPRGNWQDESGPIVLPATPGFLPDRIESTEAIRLTRLDLANWLVSDANPLTPRVVMNRLWAMFFGVGLSTAVDDLGSQGESPTHPELLDWLACEFRDSGWDVKHMIRLIVTSQTYRRSTVLPREAAAVDPANRLLCAQNPRRLEAEFVRDNALAIAGLIVLDEVGGPSTKPYQPAEYYGSLQFPNREYVADADQRQWRRGLYTHWQRTFLHPMLANFDAPARDECAAVRIPSNTPQQALTLLNDPIFVEAARVFAARLLADPSVADDAGRIRLGFRAALNREPEPEEARSMAEFLTAQRAAFAESPSNAEKLLAVGIAPRTASDPVEHAAWTQVARVFLNTQEVITRY